MASTARKTLRDLKLRQLDATLKPLRDSPVAVPRLGWLAEVRRALGMTTAQLGRRLGLTKQRVGALERAEADGKVTLATLRRVATALDCDLVYAVVPRTSLEKMIADRAHAVAADIVRRTAHSMALEAQRPSDEQISRQVRTLAERLAAERPSRLWD